MRGLHDHEYDGSDPVRVTATRRIKWQRQGDEG